MNTKTRFIVRMQGTPLQFPKRGVPILYQCVPTDAEATGFETKEAAVKELALRGLSASRMAIVEVPEEADPKGTK